MSTADPRQVRITAAQLREATAKLAEQKLEELTLDLSTALDKVMQDKGMSAVDLAIHGPSENTINRVRRGTNDTQLSTLVLILTALDCEIRFEIVPLGQSQPKDWKV